MQMRIVKASTQKKKNKCDDAKAEEWKNVIC